jgi:ribosome-associated translation inhibitor RaiA
MITIDSKNLKIDEKEVTAYIQQQMLDLGPHLADKSALQIRLTQKKKGYEAELTAYNASGEVQTVGWNENIFDAIKFAKEGLLEYFVEIQNEIHPQLRDEKIKHISTHGNLYLH